MIDAFITQPHYLAHAAPIWQALDPAVRGRMIVGFDPVMIPACAQWGIDAHVGQPAPSDEPVIVASGNELVAVQKAILISHGIDQTYEGLDHVCWAGGSGRENVVLFVVPDEASAKANWARYPETPCAIVGSPHVEILRQLPPYPLNEQRIAISAHWEMGHLVPELRGGFAWFENEYERLCRARPEAFVLHGHPRMMDFTRWRAEQWGVEWCGDFEQLTQRAWCYVTDNSSTLYEWAAMGRPVVAVSPIWYRRDVEHGKRFWRLCDPGPHVSDPAVLESAIDVAMADPAPIARRRQEICLELFGADLSCGASMRAAKAIESLLMEL